MFSKLKDASQTTRERRQKALASWRAGDNYVGTKPLTTYHEQGIPSGKNSGPSSTVSVDAKIGAGLCPCSS